MRKTDNLEEPARYLAECIINKLERGQKVLWLVAGGSSINLAVRAAGLLKERDLTNLKVSLTDERYGDVGHQDSNWQQLLAAGFRLKGATLQPVLNGSDMSSATSSFNNYLDTALKNCDYKLGLFGIGVDGHTAGILPGSSSNSSNDLASAYIGSDFKRITITPKAIAKLDLAVVYAIGSNKKIALEQLHKNDPSSPIPAQALQKARELIIYNDYKGE